MPLLLQFEWPMSTGFIGAFQRHVFVRLRVFGGVLRQPNRGPSRVELCVGGCGNGGGCDGPGAGRCGVGCGEQRVITACSGERCFFVDSNCFWIIEDAPTCFPLCLFLGYSFVHFSFFCQFPSVRSLQTINRLTDFLRQSPGICTNPVYKIFWL